MIDKAITQHNKFLDAVSDGDIKNARYFLDYVDPNMGGGTSIRIAVRNKDLDMFELLLPFIDDNEKMNEGIYFAMCSLGFIEGMKVFDGKRSVGMSGWDYFSYLSCAAINDELKMVDYLLNKSIDGHEYEREDWNLLIKDLAASPSSYKSMEKIFKKILKNQKMDSSVAFALVGAIENGCVENVKTALPFIEAKKEGDGRFSINFKKTNGVTYLLYIAAIEDQNDIIDLLLKRDDCNVDVALEFALKDRSGDKNYGSGIQYLMAIDKSMKEKKVLSNDVKPSNKKSKSKII